jgi:hypothetical protein
MKKVVFKWARIFFVPTARRRVINSPELLWRPITGHKDPATNLLDRVSVGF